MTTTTIGCAGRRARLMADRAEAEEARKRASLDNLAGKGDGSLKAARDRLAAIDEQIADLDAAEQGVRETEARTVAAAATKDRKSVVKGKRVSVRVDVGGGGIIQKTNSEYKKKKQK